MFSLSRGEVRLSGNVKEFAFVSNSVRLSVLATRLSAFLLLSAALIVPGRFAAAQTSPAPPQLLPYTVTAVAGGGTYGYGSSSLYNSGSTTNQACSYQAWNSSQSKYVATIDSAHTALDTVGDGCLATEVLLSSPRSAVSDGGGNVFFIDAGNNLIRRVDAHTGIVSTVAGTTIPNTNATLATTANNPVAGAKCPSGRTSIDAYGDGCLATEVAMYSPEALALDAQGNVWFTEYYLGSVREIVKATGVIQTVVNQSIVSNPNIPVAGQNGLAWSAGTGYVGYNASNVTNGTTGSTNYVTAAQGLLYRPYGLAFDKAGNLYIGDNYNNVVDVVNLSNTTRPIAGYPVYPNEIFTIAGSGCTPRWDTYVKGESASSSTTPTLANMSCEAIYGYSNGSSPYPSTGATMDSPYQVAIDNQGNIYIADEYNYGVRVISGTSSYTLPSGATLGLGDMGTFAGTLHSGRSATAAVSRGMASSTKLYNPYGVATDSQGNVYIADYASTSDYIERVDVATGELYPIAGELTTSAPSTAGLAPAGYKYCTSPGNATPFLPGYTDDVGDGCPGLQSSIWKAYFPFVDAAGNLYLGDSGNGLVRKLSVGAQFPTIAKGASVAQTLEIHFGANDTPAASGAYALPSGFSDFTLGTATCGAANSDGTMDCTLPVTFVPTAAGLRTAPLTVTSAKGLKSTFALTGTGLAPVLAVDPGTQTALATTGLTSVSNIAIDTAGNVYAAVPGASSITVIAPGGTATSVGATLTGANAVAVDAAGNLYTTLSSGSVVEVPANGGAQTTIGSGFTTPTGIALDSFGNVYVADEAASSVTEILAGTGAQVVLANSATVPGLLQPTGIAVDSNGNVFVSSTVANSVIELPFNASAAVTLGTGLSAPLGLALDPAGSLYVADSKNGRVVYIPNENGTLDSNDQIAIVTGLGTPTGVAIATNGTAYISDSHANAVYQIVRSSAAINFGSVNLGVGTVAAGAATAPADIISMGSLPAAFSANFATAGGANAADFALSPSSIPLSSGFPNAGYGISLTASFSPSGIVPGPRNGTFTFGSTSPASEPVLSLSGSATHPAETATVTVSTTPPAGQADWVYGQTPVLTVTVTSNNSNAQETPNGNVVVTINGTAYPVAPLGSSNTAWQGTATVQAVSLGAGAYSVSAAYLGDNNFGTANSAPFSFTVDKAPLTVTGATINKPYGAPIPTLTGTYQGLASGDAIQVSYTTSAVATSPVTAAGYPIVPAVTGNALNNYSVTLVNGALNVTPEPTQAALSASSLSVNSTTQVTLTATVAAQTSYSGVSMPTGYVAFYDTVNGVTSQIGANAQVNAAGVASLATSFASGATTTNNVVTATYLGDNNYQASAPTGGMTIVSGTPTFALTPPTSTSVTVAAGQSGLMSFNMTPAFGYDGTIAFSCSGAPATVMCSFSPASIVSNGTSNPILVALTINSQTAQSSVKMPTRVRGSEKLLPSLAILPGLLLLAGFARRSRKVLRKYLPLVVVALVLIGTGLSGCGGTVVPGTPSGAKTITVVATGSGGSFAGVTQQFTVTLNVQ